MDSRNPDIPTDAAPLPSGARMPLLGFGTWQITGEDAVTATRAALDAGYRHLDTATIYGNEAEVGRALRHSGVAREEVFVTTKCPPDLAPEAPQRLEDSLRLLGTEYVDLWLIHWPGDGGVWTDLWRTFVRARDKGLVRDIGVSNFPLGLVDEVTDATGTKPAVNQVKWRPALFDRAVVQGHAERGIVLEGYSALRGGTLEDPTVRAIAEAHGRTPAQVVVRWHLQHGIVVIPKSTKVGRIRSNADVGGFTLTEQEMAELDALGR
jgi:diketogulonate reductase-like aldo/keto reductase